MTVQLVHEEFDFESPLKNWSLVYDNSLEELLGVLQLKSGFFNLTLNGESANQSRVCYRLGGGLQRANLKVAIVRSRSLK